VGPSKFASHFSATPCQAKKVKVFSEMQVYVAKQKRYKFVIRKMKKNRETITTAKIMSAW